MSPPDFHHDAARSLGSLKGLNDGVIRLVCSKVVPVVVTDGAGRCVVANAPFLDLIGRVPGTRAPDALRWGEFALPAERPLDERAASDARMHGAAAPYERTLVCPDGHRIRVLVGALAISTEEPALLWFVIDLGGRRRSREEDAAFQREEKWGEAESVRRAKDEFLAVLSHELRAPLQGVFGWISLLREGRLDPAQQAHAYEAIERCARRQMQVVNDLLDVSRIVAGTFTVDSRHLELSEVARRLVEEFRPLAAQRGIEFESGISECGVTFGDPERLRQVLANLLSNALKFTPAGGAVRVRCEQVGGEVVLQVTDTGEGIRPQFLPHVFEQFRQADCSSSRRHGGLGLGLAITRRLVELHGGVITAESAGLGRGATFTVRLPASQRDLASAAAFRERAAPRSLH
ncbi:MAG TPA: HAMP domain-containing sensor histidine kinase [Candidatus Binatia bacterium]|nr:HAMP domain-containing sensor histidine kinase [Candidatus Binatia bacterium]